MSAPRTIRIAILAMGGEGGGVLANWLVDLAEHNGHLAQMTSVPGVAQRTGATIYYVEMTVAPCAPDIGPNMALMPVPGDVDLVIASELMEAGRAIQRGFVTFDRTTLIASTSRVHAMTEKITVADGRVDETALREACELAARRFVGLDLARVARETGSVISAAIFGVIAATNVLPFGRAVFEATIERGGIGVAASKCAFGAAFALVVDRPVEAVAPTVAEMPLEPGDIPAPAAAFAAIGVERLTDYQGASYAAMYLDRLRRIARVDAAPGAGSFQLTVLVARHLALAMAYEDIYRVADLKTRKSRFARVAAEVGVRDGQVLRIAEFLHPRAQEIAESVPAWLGRFLASNAVARRILSACTSKGRIVATTSLPGFLLLFLTARLRGLRPSSMRFAETQADLEDWLGRIALAAESDYALALEIAECRNLVKGYGETFERGLSNYRAIFAAMDRLTPEMRKSNIVAAWRKAAVADDTGDKLRLAIASTA